MNFSIYKNEVFNILTLEEKKLTAEFAPKFKIEILLIAENNKSIICDLKNVDYIDSSGLSSFLIGERISKEKKSKFVLCNVSDRINSLIKLSKLDSVFIILPSLIEAKDYVMFDHIEKNL